MKLNSKTGRIVGKASVAIAAVAVAATAMGACSPQAATHRSSPESRGSAAVVAAHTDPGARTVGEQGAGETTLPDDGATDPTKVVYDTTGASGLRAAANAFGSGAGRGIEGGGADCVYGSLCAAFVKMPSPGQAAMNVIKGH